MRGPDFEQPSFFVRYYLELSSAGELAVRSLTAGNSDSECLWSTTSCNAYVAALKELQIGRRRVGKECLRLCRSRWSPYH